MSTRLSAFPLAAAFTMALLGPPLAADPIPDDPWAELKKGQHIYVFDRDAAFGVPFLTIDDWDEELGLPPGTCSIRFTDIDAWYWGNPVFMDELEPLDVNGNVDLLYDSNEDGVLDGDDSGLIAYDFVVYNLPLPECENEPLVFSVPLALNGNAWAPGANLLVVQTAPQSNNFSSNVEFLDVNGTLLEAPEPPESDPPEPDPCETWPSAFQCANDFDLPPCVAPPWNPDACGEAGKTVQLAIQALPIFKTVSLQLDKLAGLFAENPSDPAIAGVVDLLGRRQGQAETRFGSLRDASADLADLLSRHPAPDSEPFRSTWMQLDSRITLADRTLGRCSSAIGALQRAAALTGLNADVIAAAQARCAISEYSLERTPNAALRLWTIGLAEPPEEDEE